jgi:hypothetical protein
VRNIPIWSQSQPASSIFLHSSVNLDRSDYLGLAVGHPNDEVVTAYGENRGRNDTLDHVYDSD